MRPETLTELCERYRIARPEDTRGKRFANFGGFNQVYWAACHCIRTQEDLARLILEVAEDAASQGAWWIEPAFDAERFSTLRKGSPYQLFKTQEEGWLFALAAAETANKATGVGIGFMSAIDRTMPLEQGLNRAQITAGLVRTGEHKIESGMECYNGRYPGIVALGLHGNEEGYTPEKFKTVFKIGAADAGLLSTPHAGEIAPFKGGGPASVASAIDYLGADRLLHGVLAIEDPALVDRLARDNICLDICPSSNLQLSVFPSIEKHPLPKMLEAGVPCDIGSDDPLLFGPNLLDEYELCRNELGLGDQLIATLARDSFVYSGAPSEVKAAGTLGVNAWLN
jgi:adenosine deaminase